MSFGYAGNLQVTGNIAASGKAAQSPAPSAPTLTITQIAESISNVITLTVSGNTLMAGGSVYLSGLTKATWLNGQTVTLIAGTSATHLVFNDPASSGGIWSVTGSVTSGVFTADEQVVQNVTGATATLIGTVTGAGPMIITQYVPPPTADSSDIWVGQTSAAQFTPTAVPVLATITETGTAQNAATLGVGLTVTGDVTGVHDIAQFFVHGAGTAALSITPSGDLVGATGASLLFESPANGFTLQDDSGVVSVSGTVNNFLGVDNAIALTVHSGSVLRFTNFTTGSAFADTSVGTLTGFNGLNMTNSGATHNILIDNVSTVSTTISIQVPTAAGGGVFVISPIGLPGDFTGQTASIGSTTLLAVPATGAGMYRLSYYLSTATTGTGAVTLTNGWNDGVATQSTTSASLSLTANGFVQGTLEFFAQLSTNITFLTTSTAGGGATYNLRQRLEFLG